MSRLCSTYFSSSGSFTVPAGVTRLYLLGHGGGAGGNGGRNATGSQSILSGATTPYLVAVEVTPNTSYTVTIGAGGTGGGPRTSASSNANKGGNTTFGSLHTFIGGYTDASFLPDTGEISGVDVGHVGGKNLYEYAVNSGFVSSTTTLGNPSGSYVGGQRGLPGYAGSAGGTGGNANSVGAGVNGGNATGFGASGGAGGNGVTGGSGGNGAPGQLWVIWVE